MATEFNFKRAWDEWAHPRFCAMGRDVHLAIEAVRVVAPTLQQRGANRVEFPDNLPLRASFDVLDPAAVQEAGKVVYYYGHWAYKGTPGERLQDHGLYWKFEHLADAWLIANGHAPSKVWYDANFKIDGYMDHKPGTPYDTDEVAKLLAPSVAPEFEVVGCKYVNHRVEDRTGKPITHNDRRPGEGMNHPFMITLAHFPTDGGMYIQPEQAPCGLCGRPYDQHKSDVALFVKPTRDLANAEAGTALNRAKLLVEEHNAANPKDKVRLDGFAFPKSQFTIAPPEEAADVQGE
jgi:hypothetical protein